MKELYHVYSTMEFACISTALPPQFYKGFGGIQGLGEVLILSLDKVIVLTHTNSLRHMQSVTPVGRSPG
jgi:hypothetical protein